MRISRELEKILKEIEENNSDNGLSLLDVVNAMEKTYDCVNRSFLKDEIGFSEQIGDYQVVKKGYDAVSGKMVYAIKGNSDEELITIGISNLGEMSFKSVSLNDIYADLLIKEINAPSNDKVMEKMKMNSEISFFTENCELVISKKPYLAIKMGNFVEGNKAVLVYKDEVNKDVINKIDSSVKHIKVEQIEDYLKNIKVDERMIPTLMYAFIGYDFERTLLLDKIRIERTTYPYLTPEKVTKLKSSEYFTELNINAVMMGMWGAFLFGILSGAISICDSLIGEIFSQIEILSVCLGVSVLTSVGYYFNGKKNIKRAYKKDELMDKAFIEFYKTLKSCALENMENLEKRYRKSNNRNDKKKDVKKDSELSNLEIISKIKELLGNVKQDKAIFCNIVLDQILNIYKAKNSDISLELMDLFMVVKKIDDYSMSDLINYSINSVENLLSYGDGSSSIEVLNNLDYAIATKGDSNIALEKEKWNKAIRDGYFEVLLSNNVSVREISNIPKITRLLLLEDCYEFVEQLKYEEDNDKNGCSKLLDDELGKDLPSGVRIYKTVNLIKNKGLEKEFLGKEIKGKEKVLK